MNNQDKIVAIFLNTESDEHLYCLGGSKEQILEAIKNKLYYELGCVWDIVVEPYIPHGIEDESDEAGTYRQFANEIEELIIDEVNKMLGYD